MPVPISDLQSVNPSSIIELFQLTLVSSLHGTPSSSDSGTYYFTGMTDAVTTGNNAYSPIHWGNPSKEYQRLPIQASGFEYNGAGQLPRPKLVVSNLFSTFSEILSLVNAVTPGNDLVGARVVRIRTLLKYLPNENFTGDNPYGTPDVTQEFPQESYIVARKSLESREFCEFELAAAIDMANTALPKRQLLPSAFPGIGGFY
tara:strand:- start:11679 stop:12284 length:606 start_codon:yes stop_codon:yes gene_type:complete